MALWESLAKTGVLIGNRHGAISETCALEGDTTKLAAQLR